MTEGFVPPPSKVGASHTLQIRVNNPPNMVNYLDLQYGDHDLEGITQVPQQKALQTNVIEEPMEVNQFKAI